MPQLDIYTYFTQFQWLLVVFSLIFILINGQFIPTFQSLFVIRNFIGTLLDSQKTESKDGQTLKEFAAQNKAKVVAVKMPQESLTIVSQWDQIFEKYRTEATKTHSKKSSNKVNDSQKIKSGKKKVIITSARQDLKNTAEKKK
jgi:hypothetical protein